MGNPQANLAAAFKPPETPASGAAAGGEVEQPVEQPIEQPRDFHFAVTWMTLFAQLDLMESSCPRQHPPAAPILDLVPVATPPLLEPVLQDGGRNPCAGWEMVVPKMVRTGPGQFTPVDSPGRDS